MNIWQTIKSIFVKPVEVVEEEPLTKDERLYLALIREAERQRVKDELKKVKREL